MNSLILCEGATDAILLSYFLEKVSGWTYSAKAPDGLNIRSPGGNEKVFSLIDEVIKSVPWESYESLRACFKPLESI